MKQLILMCGIPGAGKSTYIRDNIWYSFGEKEVSRDRIRFLMTSDKDDYFSKEKEVFEEYISEIQNALNDPAIFRVYADATQLTEKSRNKVLDRLDLKEAEISVFWKKTPLETCLKQNDTRPYRQKVPEEQIKKMWERMEDPHNDKKYKYKEVRVI